MESLVPLQDIRTVAMKVTICPQMISLIPFHHIMRIMKVAMVLMARLAHAWKIQEEKTLSPLSKRMFRKTPARTSPARNRRKIPGENQEAMMPI